MTVPHAVFYFVALGGFVCLAILAYLVYLLENSEIERGREL